MRCDACMARQAGAHDIIHGVEQRFARLELQRQTSEVLSHARRDSTMAVHRRAHGYLHEYAALFGALALPSTAVQLSHCLVYLLCGRERTLSPATVNLVVGVVSEWHQTAKTVTGFPLANPCQDTLIRTLMRAAQRGIESEAKGKLPLTAPQLVRTLHFGFDLNTVGGRHDRLLFAVLLLGPLRPGVATGLRIHYHLAHSVTNPHLADVVFSPESQVWVKDDIVYLRVSKDKNVHAGNQRVVAVPSGVLGLNLPRELLFYLRHCSPPSGGTLFAAPTNPRGTFRMVPSAFAFNNNPYTASCEMVRRAVSKALPTFTREELAMLGGGTPRKTMAQLVWSVTRKRRVVVDVGGWSSGRDKDAAVDRYFTTTEPQRVRLLRGFARSLLEAQELSEADVAICEAAASR